MGDEQIEYVCRPASAIPAVSERQQLATVSLEPLRPFPIVSDDGEIVPAEEEVLRASPPGAKSSPWGTYSVASATCLQPSMILVTDDNEGASKRVTDRARNLADRDLRRGGMW